MQLLDEMSTDGYAARLDVTESGAYSARIIPTVTNEDGLPVFARGEDFDRIASRLVRLSAELGTSLRVDGDTLTIEQLA